jgi:hypothetical protein
LHASIVQGLDEGLKLGEIGSDKEQALDGEQPVHRLSIPWIASEAEDRLRRVGDYASSLDAAGGEVQLVVTDGRVESVGHAFGPPICIAQRRVEHHLAIPRETCPWGLLKR